MGIFDGGKADQIKYLEEERSFGKKYYLLSLNLASLKQRLRKKLQRLKKRRENILEKLQSIEIK